MINKPLEKYINKLPKKVIFCKKCVESYKIDNKKNTVSGAKLKPRKPKPSGITPEKIARSPFAKMGMRMIGFIGGSMIMVIIITALVGR